MKKISLFTFCCLLFSISMFAQSVGINNTTPHASAILDVKSNNKGVLLPRTSTTSRVAIVSPAKGLILYDTTTSGFWFHNGTAWAQLSGGGNGWSLTGNAGTSPVSNFIGTTDNQPLRFRVNNAWAGEIHPSTGNVSFGLGAGASNSGGQSNTAIGTHSLFSNTGGYNNTANGNYALNFNTTGFDNTANGSSSLFFNTTGNSNTGNGTRSLFNNTTGDFNTATGVDALSANTIGIHNTANGYQALYSNTTGLYNTANGSGALSFNTTGNYNTANGNFSLLGNTLGNNNTANGYESLTFNSSGNNNTANGVTALYSNTSGNDNTANGYQALTSNTSGAYNTATGDMALTSNTTAISNTADGFKALYSNSTGSYNTAAGTYALSDNSVGYGNTAFGSGALTSNITGNNNVAIGSNALLNNTGGNYNIAIGFQSGIHPSTPNIYNTISIGNDDILNAYQNQVFIGNTSTAFIGGKVPWSVISDARVKNNIVEDVRGLDFILKLRPVTYHISNDAITTLTGSKKTPDFPGKYDGEKIKYSGFLAQEVEQACKDAGYDFSGYAAPKNQWGFYTLSYEQFVVPLVKAVQEQEAIINNQQKQIDLLEKRLTVLESKL